MTRQSLGLPYLAVALVSDEIMGTLTAETAEEARSLIVRIGDELDKWDCQTWLQTKEH